MGGCAHSTENPGSQPRDRSPAATAGNGQESLGQPHSKAGDERRGIREHFHAALNTAGFGPPKVLHGIATGRMQWKDVLRENDFVRQGQGSSDYGRATIQVEENPINLPGLTFDLYLSPNELTASVDMEATLRAMIPATESHISWIGQESEPTRVLQNCDGGTSGNFTRGLPLCAK